MTTDLEYEILEELGFGQHLQGIDGPTFCGDGPMADSEDAELQPVLLLSRSTFRRLPAARCALFATCFCLAAAALFVAMQLGSARLPDGSETEGPPACLPLAVPARPSPKRVGVGDPMEISAAMGGQTPADAPTPPLTIGVTPSSGSFRDNADSVRLALGRALAFGFQAATVPASAKSDGIQPVDDSHERDAISAVDDVVPSKPISSGPQLPAGLMADGTAEIDAGSGLPARAWSAVLADAAPMEFVLVPRGEYRLDLADRPRGLGTEFRTVALPMDTYVACREASITQYAAFYRAKGAEVGGETWLAPAHGWVADFDADAVPSAPSALPATNMSVEEAQRFCEWIGGRLPTESEWESVASFYLGFGLESAAAGPKLGSFRLRRPGKALVPLATDSSQVLTPTGEIHHLMGNVAEWCRDSEPQGDSVVKGCSFLTPPGDHVHPGWRSTGQTGGAWDVGIRVVLPVHREAIGGLATPLNTNRSPEFARLFHDAGHKLARLISREGGLFQEAKAPNDTRHRS